MKEVFRDKNISLPALLYILVGLVLTIFPGATLKIIGYVFASMLLLAGVLMVVKYATKSIETMFIGNDLVVGVILIVLAVYVYANVEVVASIIPTMLGIVVLVSGIGKLQNAIGLKRIKYDSYMKFFVLAAINIVIGFILIANPFKTMEVTMRLIGIALLLCGLSDFITLHFIGKKVKEYMRSGEFETEAREVDE